MKPQYLVDQHPFQRHAQDVASCRFATQPRDGRATRRATRLRYPRCYPILLTVPRAIGSAVPPTFPPDTTSQNSKATPRPY
ncbi:hypothetical protein Spb1_34440 [Planctopirus ephydatiae]|uniref:Uncharacterized protein n=1 Tax=Planctopirus ephydatiae TaxID=2528019 RepID=A0A518GSD1_9PLAN|nr:hypothetical protein Spb1_34440 [Planctopirus ephydatiae]